jgi:hypothetical protein
VRCSYTRSDGSLILPAGGQCNSSQAALRHNPKLENLMSNEIKSTNMNEQSGPGNHDSSRATETPKGDQQSQGTPRTDKGMPQQGGSDHKSGQQSQGGSRPVDVNDPKKTSDITQKSTQPK